MAILFNHLITDKSNLFIIFIKVYQILIGSLIASINYLNFGISINDF